MKFLKQAFEFLFKTNSSLSVAHDLYWQIVTVSRNPKLYQKFSIPDTLDGRFDCLMVHLFIVIQHLENMREHQVAAHLLDFFVKDMDRSLRETGVGDPSITRKMRKIGEAYLGRMNAYSVAFQTDNIFDIKTVLHKNVYRLAPVSDSCLYSFAHYIYAYKEGLKNFTLMQKLPECSVQLVAPHSEVL